jgi:multidrug efflux pump subunit AcrB
MNRISSWFIHNPVAANLLMILLLIAGTFTANTIRIEGFPALAVNSLTISTLFPGADAHTVDQSVSVVIERALEGIPGTKEISSYSFQDYSSITIVKETSYDIDTFQNDIQTRLASLSTLPARAERPIITRDEFTIEALLVQVYGDVDPATLQKTARFVKRKLAADPRIVKMSEFGLLPHEIRIEVDTETLNAYHISLADIAQLITSSSLDYQAGKLNSADGKILITTDDKAVDHQGFMKIPVVTAPDGTTILLRDVATVIEGFADEDSITRFQGSPSIGMQLFTSKKGHIIEVSEAAHAIVKELSPLLPAGVHVELWGDAAVYMNSRLRLLQMNAIQGLIIIFALLAVFLHIELAFWVAAGIPVSIAGTLAIMGERFLDYSLNDITTFGLIIVLGILVDDAIVVGESVFEERKKLIDPIQGTIRGVNKVATATVFGCFTTIAAFYPLLVIDNDLGRIFASFSVVVIVALLVSLVESKLILPSHLTHVNIGKQASPHLLPRLWGKVQYGASKFLDILNMRIYQPILKIALSYTYSFLVIFIVIAVIGISFLFNGSIKTVFFPEVPGQIIVVNVKMENGSLTSTTLDTIDTIEAAAQELNQEIMQREGLTDPPIAKIMSIMENSQKVIFYAELLPDENRRIDTIQIVDSWREKTGILESVEQLSFSGSLETGGGFILNVSEDTEENLRAAVTDLVPLLRGIPGFQNITGNLEGGTPKIVLRLKDESRHLGLTNADLASQIGDGYGGIEVQRMIIGNEEVKVRITYPEDQRRSLHDLQNSLIRTSTGAMVPLLHVATIEREPNPLMIERNDGIRTVTIEAQLDTQIISSTEAFQMIKDTIEPQLRRTYPGLSIEGAGEIEEMNQMSGELKKVLIIILLLIYSLIAIPLRSYWQPLVILSVIPFGFVGAILGHYLTGFPISVLSLFGMLAVMGIVVNDSLVMMTRFNELQEEGESLDQALLLAGGSRFRPIFLTTVTTVCGLLPLIFETSEQAQYLIPAAISLAFGELFATPVTLVLIPLLLRIGNDAGRRMKTDPITVRDTQ